MNKILSITKALSDGNRLRILMALWENRELCACQITELLAITGATVSRHLTVLSHAGLIESRKDGRWVNYRLREAPEHDLMFGWLKQSLEATTQHKADRIALQSILAEDREDVCRRQRGEACCPSKPARQP